MTPGLPAKEFLAEFILEQASEQPLERRILLYRALSVELRHRDLQKKCTALADELESIEARHNQLLLDLRQGGAK
jgi:hypothetical protein